MSARGNGKLKAGSLKIGTPQRWLLELEERFATLMRAGDVREAILQLRAEAEKRGMNTTELGRLVAQIGVQRGHTNPILQEEPPSDPSEDRLA